MRLNCDVKSFRAAFRQAGTFVKDKSPRVIYQTVRLEAGSDGVVTMTGTDGETWVEARVEGVDVIEPGAAAIPRKIQDGILAATKDERMSFELTPSGRLKVRGRTIKFDVGTEDPTLFGLAKGLDAPATIRVSADDLARCIRRTVAVPAGTEVAEVKGRVLTGLLVEWSGEDGEMALVGADSHRAARQSAAAECVGGPPDATGPIIPGSFATTLAGMLGKSAGDVEIGFVDRGGKGAPSMIVFRWPGVVVATALLVGRFPPYQAGFKAYPVTHSYRVAVEPLRGAIEAVSVAATETTRRAGLEFVAGEPGETGKLRLSLAQGDAGAEAEVDAPHEGDPVSSGFDYRYLGQPLRAIDDDLVDLDLCGQDGPLIFRTGGFSYITMSRA